MPWSNQSGGGGPWGSGGGNNNGGSGGGGGRGPWGGPPGGNTPPDLEELFRRGQDRFKNMVPGGGGGIGALGMGIIAACLILAWALSGFYRVQAGEVGINMLFGNILTKSGPGLSWNYPWPIGSVEKANVTEVNTTTVGNAPGRTSDESLMLTGDENIVDVNFSVQWRVSAKTPEDYVFNMQSPRETVKAVAESSMREAIGRRTIEPILTGDRQAIEDQVKDLMQKALDNYRAGVIVSVVQLQKVDPPSQVIGAFRDVQAARADQERATNEAQIYANGVVPVARGEASRITQSAEAYRDRTVVEAKGQASRFTQVYEAYKAAPDITRQRMYLETMSDLLSGADKIIIDEKSSGGGVVPYLPLDKFMRTTPETPPRPVTGVSPTTGTGVNP